MVHATTPLVQQRIQHGSEENVALATSPSLDLDRGFVSDQDRAFVAWRAPGGRLPSDGRTDGQ